VSAGRLEIVSDALVGTWSAVCDPGDVLSDRQAFGSWIPCAGTSEPGEIHEEVQRAALGTSGDGS
jgi:hypothetical protein